MFSFTITATDSRSLARRGKFETPHGVLETPALAIVGTEGQVKSLTPELTKTLPMPYSIVNTFHIWTKQIIPKIKETNPAATVHAYGGFPGVVASDSGGFQVFSLGFGKVQGIGKVIQTLEHVPTGTVPQEHVIQDSANPLVIIDEGVTFEWNNEQVTLTPELSMQLQHQIGADIIFAFDECTSPLNSKEYTEKSLDLTHAWLERCIAEHKRLSREQTTPQALFGIIQGGVWPDLREKAAKQLAKADVPGYGIGGAFGENGMYTMLEHIAPHLPFEKPRHLLGIGKVRDIFESVERGVDLFDCVIPTREARHRMIYTKKGRLNIKKFKTVHEIIDKNCTCLACREGATWSQIDQMFRLKDPRGYMLATVHNIHFFADLMTAIREAITHVSFSSLKEQYIAYY